MIMAEIHSRLSGIIDSLAQLRKERDELKKEIHKMREELKEKAARAEQLQAELEEKVKTIHILQTANSLNSSEDKEEAKKQVDDLLREIDYCLKLLDS